MLALQSINTRQHWSYCYTKASGNIYYTSSAWVPMINSSIENLSFAIPKQSSYWWICIPWSLITLTPHSLQCYLTSIAALQLLHEYTKHSPPWLCNSGGVVITTPDG